MRSPVTTTIAVLAVLVTVEVPLHAEVFDEPKNLEVLPADISPEELRRTMVGFSSALNARCSYCHDVDDDLKRAILTLPATSSQPSESPGRC